MHLIDKLFNIADYQQVELFASPSTQPTRRILCPQQIKDTLHISEQSYILLFTQYIYSLLLWLVFGVLSR